MFCEMVVLELKVCVPLQFNWAEAVKGRRQKAESRRQKASAKPLTVLRSCGLTVCEDAKLRLRSVSEGVDNTFEALLREFAACAEIIVFVCDLITKKFLIYTILLLKKNFNFQLSIFN